MDVPVDVRGWCQNVILYCCPPYFLRHSLCTEPEVCHLAEAGQHIVSASRYAAVTDVHGHAWSTRDWNSGLYACIASTFLPKPPLCPLLLFYRHLHQFYRHPLYSRNEMNLKAPVCFFPCEKPQREDQCYIYVSLYFIFQCFILFTLNFCIFLSSSKES